MHRFASVVAFSSLIAMAFASCRGSDDSGPCVRDGDCAGDRVCLYRADSGCSARGECMSLEATCSASSASPVLCGCNGETLIAQCNHPLGYVAAPVRAEGTCPTLVAVTPPIPDPPRPPPGCAQSLADYCQSTGRCGFATWSLITDRAHWCKPGSPVFIPFTPQPCSGFDIATDPVFGTDNYYDAASGLLFAVISWRRDSQGSFRVCLAGPRDFDPPSCDMSMTLCRYDAGADGHDAGSDAHDAAVDGD